MYKKFCCILIFITGFHLLVFPSHAQSDIQPKKKKRTENFSSEERTARAADLRQDPIEIDGKLDESSWKLAPVLTDFTQYNPDEGNPATEKTEVKVLFSKDALYIGVRALDSEAGKIRAILARRDSQCPSDWIKIWIDSYHDHLTAFEFAVNPCGVKRDVYWSNDRRKDDDWDAVWDVEVSMDDRGWVAEFKIPFSQIRFPERDSHTWGFQVSRVIARKNETSYWRHVPKGTPRFVSLFGELTGISRIPPPKRIELLPYTVGKGSFKPAEEGNPFETGASYLTNLGLDLKYGVSSNLTMDATFNPDFGQVEVDPAVVNLSAYETYFQEKRPFFIEGKSILSFPLAGSTERDGLFYSRRIGRAPQGYPSSAEFYEKPQNTTILGAFKLTGKTAQGWSIGIMEALTSREYADVINWEGESTKQTVEPFTNYFLVRAEKEFREGRSTFGLIFTAVNRNIKEENLDFLRKSAYSGGFGFRHRWARDTYEVSGSLLGSHIRGSQEAILEAQESSARYFQRPDAPHLEVDPTRTSLSGISASFSLGKIGGRHWRWSIVSRTRSPGFEVNDMGYMRSTDQISQYIWLSYREFMPGKIFRDYDLSFTFSNSWDYSLTHTGQGGSLRCNFRFLNYWSINFNTSRTQEYLSTRHLRGGPAVLIPGNWNFGGSFRTDSRKNFYLNIRGSFNVADNGAKSYSLSSSINLRPSDRIHLSLSPSFRDNYRRLQYLTRESMDDRTHYILGRIDQTTLSLTVRLNYTLTPNLSLQIYSQPYVSAGKYSEFKDATQLRAENYDERWHIFSGNEIFFENNYYHLIPPEAGGDEISIYNPDFNFRQFRLNLVLRWEYLPGSVLFLVWTNGINDYANTGSLSLGDDFKSLFNSPSHNVFLIKVSYWFNI